MIKNNKIVPLLFNKLLSKTTREKTEKIILKTVIFSFFYSSGDNLYYEI
jgi:hypothetical protein